MKATELWASSAPRHGVRGAGRGAPAWGRAGRLEWLWPSGNQGGRRQGGGGATHLSILALKSNTPSINLAANLEGPVRDQKAVWTPRRRSLGQRHQRDGSSLVQGSDLLPSSSLTAYREPEGVQVQKGIREMRWPSAWQEQQHDYGWVMSQCPLTPPAEGLRP